MGLLEDQAAGGNSSNKELMKLRRELKGIRRGACQEETNEDGDLKMEQLKAQKAKELEALMKQRNRQMMLHARGIFDGTVSSMQGVQLWLDMHKRRNLPILDHAEVEANPEESSKVNEMPLERTLGQPAVVFRRPKSSFSKFYAKVNPPVRPQTKLPNSLR